MDTLSANNGISTEFFICGKDKKLRSCTLQDIRSLCIKASEDKPEFRGGIIDALDDLAAEGQHIIIFDHDAGYPYGVEETRGRRLASWHNCIDGVEAFTNRGEEVTFLGNKLYRVERDCEYVGPRTPGSGHLLL